jgi:hypothetical protein
MFSLSLQREEYRSRAFSGAVFRPLSLLTEWRVTPRSGSFSPLSGAITSKNHASTTYQP